jgi:hypothetical protein
MNLSDIKITHKIENQDLINIGLVLFISVFLAHLFSSIITNIIKK